MFALSLIWDAEPSPGASPSWALLACPEAAAPKSRQQGCTGGSTSVLAVPMVGHLWEGKTLFVVK